MRFGTLGTGVVGKTIAARVAGLGHNVVIGIRDRAKTTSRIKPDAYGNPRSAPARPVRGAEGYCYLEHRAYRMQVQPP